MFPAPSCRLWAWSVAALLATAANPSITQAQDKDPPTKPGVDVLGDPLPVGALARCGTTRFRHNGGISAAAFSRDGKTLATVGGDAVVHVWEFPSGKLLRRLAGHKYTVHYVAFSGDGKRLFASDGSQAILVWDPATGQLLERYEGEPKGASPFALSADGKWLANVVEPQWSRVRVRDLQTGRDVHLLPEGKTSISGLAFSPDGRTLAVVSHISGVQIWETVTGQLRETFDKLKGQATAAAFTPDGKSLIVGTSKAIHVFELKSGKEIRQFGPDHLWPGSLAVTSDSKTLAVPLSEGAVALWDLTTGREIRRWQTEFFWGASGVAFSPDDKVLLTTAGSAGNATHLGLWDVATGKPLHPQVGHTSRITGLALSKDGKSLASTSADGTLRLWDPATGQERKRIAADKSKPFHCVAFSPDGKTLATGTQKGGLDDILVQLWSADTGKELRRFGKGPQTLYSIAFSPSGKTVAGCGSHDAVFLWDPDSGQETGRLVAEKSGWMSSLAFSPDGKMLVSGHALKEAWVWDLATAAPLQKLKHSGTVRAVAFSADNQMVATAAADDCARLWNTGTGAELARCVGHSGQAMAVALSPNGKWLASAGLRGRGIRLWDIATGLPLVEFGGEDVYHTALAFSPDSKKLISAGINFCLIVWDVAVVLEKYQPAAVALTDKELKSLWDALASGDAAVGFKAIRVLAASPQQAVPFLEEMVKLPVPSKEVAQLVADLSAKEFATRENATAALMKLDKDMAPVLQRLLDEAPNPEVSRRLEQVLQKMGVEPLPRSYALREVRAVEVLEMIGSKEARKTLQLWVSQLPASRVGREAKAALDRLGK
jgi:WD40 repeat protein